MRLTVTSAPTPAVHVGARRVGLFGAGVGTRLFAYGARNTVLRAVVGGLRRRDDFE